MLKIKERLLEKNWMTKGNAYEASPMILNIMDEYAKEVAIDYSNFKKSMGIKWNIDNIHTPEKELFKLYLKEREQ